MSLNPPLQSAPTFDPINLNPYSEPEPDIVPTELPAYTTLPTDWMTDNPIMRILDAASPQEELEGQENAQLSAESETIMRQSDPSVQETPEAMIQAQAPESIQREDNENEGSGVNFDYNLLPPKMKLSLGQFNLGANTSSAQLGYGQGPWNAQLGYNYGSDIFAGGSYGDFSGKFGFNPGTEVFSLGGSYNQFNFGANAGLNGSVGLNLGYGSPLLPMPNQLGEKIYAGEAGLRGIVSGLPGALNDPMGFYRSQGDNIDSVKSTYGLLSQIAGQQNSGQNFGAGLNMSYGSDTGFYLGAGLQGRF
ncbi:MAG TPA: hypothetical protein DDZ80_00175 [Cyanobacteria bacterium UBA8803]|nr:hypothetical protein [Cyanobacteria bacterium UBA9273]HBL57033.1 hypothetical protein [Cyanobacteria bacterium UBA8803]